MEGGIGRRTNEFVTLTTPSILLVHRESRSVDTLPQGLLRMGVVQLEGKLCGGRDEEDTVVQSNYSGFESVADIFIFGL